MNAAAVIIPELTDPAPLWIATLAVYEGQQVEAGQRMARLEGHQGHLDLLAPQNGYVTGLRAFPGQAANPGEVLCYLAEQPTLAPAQPGAALSKFLENTPLDPSAMLIYGGGGHGKAVLEMLRAVRVYRVIGWIDDGLPSGSDILGLPVLGGAASLREWYKRGVRLAANGVGGIGNAAVRIKVFDTLAQEGFSCPAQVHPTAMIEPSAVLEPGVQVLPHGYVGSSSRVGFGSLINIGAIVAHDCHLGRVTNLSPGAALAGFVHVGDHTQIGMNATVNLNLTIGAGCLIGNGATVKADVPPGTRVWAGSTWPLRT
jgi:sugar O-acyltransferase (sialic acid O-acetyltransferase NeuD family)